MGRGDDVWLFVSRKGYCGKKILERGVLILKHKGIWHIKANRKIYKRKQSEIAEVSDLDRRFFDNRLRRII